MVEKIVQEIDLRGDRAVRDGLERVGVAGERAVNRMSAATTKLNSGLGRLDNGLRNLTQRIAPVGSGFLEAAAAVGNFGGALGKLAGLATLAVGGMAALAAIGGKLAGDLKEASLRVGTSSDNLTQLGFAAEQSGSSVQSLERAFGVMFDAAEQGGEALEPFKRLGIQLTDAANRARDPAVVFGEIADKIAAIENPAQRAQTVIGLFGRRVGAGLVEVLSLGSKGLDDFRKQVERLGLTITKAEQVIGEDFGDSLNSFQRAVTATTAKVGVAFIPLFSGIVDQAALLVGRLQPVLVQAATAITTTLQPVFDDLANIIAGNADKINSEFLLVIVKAVQAAAIAISTAFKAISFAFSGLIVVLNQVTAAFNALFGTTLSGADLLAFAITGRLILAMTAFLGILRAVIVSVQILRALFIALALAGGPLTLVLAAIGAAVGFLLASMSSEQWAAFAQQIVGLWNSIRSTILSVVEGVTGAWASLKNTIVGFARQMVEAFRPVVEIVTLWIARLKEGIELARQVLGGSGGGGESPGFAHGGKVSGPGTGTSDSILARLSKGEYVNTAAAVRHYGTSFFDAINRMALPRGFAMGGLVDGLADAMSPSRPAVASSALAGGSRRSLTLVLDGQTFAGLTGPEAVMERLETVAVSRQTRSTGRKPSWVG